MKPRSITFVKNYLKDIQPKVEDKVVDKSTRYIHDLFNKPNKIKQTSREIIKDIAKGSKEKIVSVFKDNIK